MLAPKITVGSRWGRVKATYIRITDCAFGGGRSPRKFESSPTMRFFAHGPEIPDDLLVARDEGKVLFFCGSGVSIARARLPGFLGLAEQVMAKLRALPDSAPYQLTKLAGDLLDNKVVGVGGIVAADRIFGLLERDFAPVDIDRAVGAVLQPSPDVDVSAHRILLSLSRTASGNIQLVTTNFDLLFEQAGKKVRSWTPNDLPDLHRSTFDGIVHLHGMLDPTYHKAVGGNLVLSSAEFGRAYLSEGWATHFIREATDKYTIVFVGYTADDPPVQYLLEALRRNSGGQRPQMYAFQSGLQAEAAALWEHKGVTAIPYDSSDHHAALWKTLADWAERASDPEAWRAKILRSALAGPEAMSPHERGQVMDLAMTPDGVKAMVTAKRQLPASWLLAFDPAERYETPSRRTFTAEDTAYDPFHDYGLDTDPTPKPDESGALFRQREVPDGVKNALVANGFDPAPTDRGAIYGNEAVTIVPLPPRLRALTAWIASVADQPLAIWWALNKPALHPALLDAVELRFRRAQGRMPDKARVVWRTILEARRPRIRSTFENIFEFQDRVKQEGWSPSARRNLIALLRPRLEVGRPYAQGPVRDIAEAKPFDILRVDLHYLEEVAPPPIPDDQLAGMTPLVRILLEEVSTQEAEINPFTLNHIPPIHFDPQLRGMTSERDHGFNRLVFWYIGLFERLMAQDPARARREFDAWLTHDNTLFYRLRVWACSLADFLPASVATATLVGLPDEAFWTERGQRDLLLALKARWNAFDPASRAEIEKRLLKGPPLLKGLSRDRWREWHAHAILGRTLWLQQEGCVFLRPIDAALAKARAAAPQWQDKYAATAADSQEARGGTVSTNLKFEHMKDVPIRELLRACIADSGRDHSFLTEGDPLGGLAEKQPMRVLRALLYNDLPDDQARWAWSKFLQANARREDTPRRTCLIARRLATLPNAIFTLIVQPAIYWLEIHAKQLYETEGETVAALVDRVIDVLAQKSMNEKESDKRSADWVNQAFSSSAGKTIETLFQDPAWDRCAEGTALPGFFVARIERALALPGDSGLFALYKVAQRLGWIYSRDADWAEANILAPLEGGDERREAVLTGFMHNMRWNSRMLYDRLKVPISQLISGEMLRPKADVRALSGFALWGWRTARGGDRWFSDTEMRTALVRGSQEFRTTTLWQVGQWPFEEKKSFLAEVWPLQLAARNSTISDRLCHLAFQDAEHFAELAEILIPFLTTIRGGALMFTAGLQDAYRLMAANSEICLEIYWRVLPENSTEWPYDGHQGLDYLYKNAKKLRADPRMIELMRRRRKGHF